MRQKDQSSHSISSFSYSAGGIYTSNQPMNIRSKNSTYFSKNNENYLDDMKQFVMQAVPHVDKMQGIVTCIQSTASARNLEELVTPMKGSKTAAASARKRASESGSASSSKVPKAA